jgi:hypothetical protein
MNAVKVLSTDLATMNSYGWNGDYSAVAQAYVNGLQTCRVVLDGVKSTGLWPPPYVIALGSAQSACTTLESTSGGSSAFWTATIPQLRAHAATVAANAAALPQYTHEQLVQVVAGRE